MRNIFRKSRTERNRRSSETRDNYFRNVESDLSNLWIGVETGALEQSVILTKIEEDLLPKYQSLISWIISAEWSGATKRQLEHRLNEDIQDLQRMERDLKKHNYTNLSEFQKRVCELEYYYTHYEQARQITILWWRTSDIHAIIDSKQDARRARRYERSDARYQQSMNAILHDAALTSLWNDDMERYEEYLEAVVNWQVEPSSHPFYQAHCQSFRMIEHTNPSLYTILAPSWKWRTQYVIPITWKIDRKTSSWNTRISSWSTRISSGQSEAFPWRIGKAFWELMSNFPSIENDPRKRQAWEQLGSVVALWWAVFMWYKMLKNIFSKKESNPNKWWKTLWWWAWLLALTNGDKIGKWLIDWVQNITWRHPSEKIQISTQLFKKYWFKDVDALRQAEMHVWAPVATMSALHFIPIYELGTKGIVEYKDNEFKFNYDNYEEYINACDWTDEQKNIVLAAWQKLKDDNSINLWFLALGIPDQNKFRSLAGSDRKKTLAECEQVQTSWKNCEEWISSGVNAELFNKWLKAKNLESAKQLINEYNQNWWDTLKDEDKRKLIIKWMKGWLVEVNDPDKKYDIEEMLNNPDIDLENMTMKWFTDSWWNLIEFKSYKELFNVVDLTDSIKKIFQGRPTVNKNDRPFHIANEKFGRIEFDDTQWYEFWKNETDVAKKKKIKENPTLRSNYKFYVDYLNKWRQNWGFLKL